MPMIKGNLDIYNFFCKNKLIKMVALYHEGLKYIHLNPFCNRCDFTLSRGFSHISVCN